MTCVTDMLIAQKLEIPTPYTEGVCGDGAAILKDGAPMKISEILKELNEYAWIKHCAELAKSRNRRHSPSSFEQELKLRAEEERQ